MENASKALIIAAAILISILLISLGLMAFNSSKDTSDQAKDVANEMHEGAQKGTNAIEGQIANLIF